MNFDLTAEEAEWMRRFNDFCRERIAPRARYVDRVGWWPEHWQQNLRELGQFGFLKLFHPTSLGGAGASGILCAMAIETLAKACSSTSLMAASSSTLAASVITEYGFPHHHKKWLQPIMRGEKVACVAIAEEGALSDERTVKCVLTRDPRGGYLVKGFKTRISVAPVADVCVCFLITDPKIRDDAAIHGMKSCYAIIDAKSPGVEKSTIKTVGLRGMPWGNWRLDNVHIDPEDVVRTGDVVTPQSPVAKAAVIEWGQVIMCCNALGVAEAAFEECVKFTIDRQAFDMNLVHLQPVHGHLADMRVQIDAARLLAYHAAQRKIASRTGGAPDSEMLFMAKVNATDLAVQLSNLAVRLHGAWGFSEEHIVERLMRDAQAFLAGGGQNDRLSDLIAGGITGVDTLHHRENTEWFTSTGLRELTRDRTRPDPWTIVEERPYLERMGTAVVGGRSYAVVGVSQKGVLLSGATAPVVGTEVTMTLTRDRKAEGVTGHVTKVGVLSDGTTGFVVAFARRASTAPVAPPLPSSQRRPVAPAE